VITVGQLEFIRTEADLFAALSSVQYGKSASHLILLGSLSSKNDAGIAKAFSTSTGFTRAFDRIDEDFGDVSVYR
jgi:hypothetical protein